MEKAARRIVERLRRHGYQAFFAGGWVRDLLLKRKPKDIDIATNARPEEILRLFPKAHAIGAQFGVIQVRLYGHSYDVATFRSDCAYLDGRRPSSVIFSGPREDARRRDFTINGLFYDPITGSFIDYVGGKDDIQDRVIRTIGDPHERFAEDKLRMLRAVRLACNLDFEIDPETWRAIKACSKDILLVSWERIRDELIQMLTGPAPDRGLDLLHNSGLFLQILPEVETLCGIRITKGPIKNMDLFKHTQITLKSLRKPSVPLAFAALLHEVAESKQEHGTVEHKALTAAEICKSVCRRLRLSNDDTGIIVELVSTHLRLVQDEQMPGSALRRIHRKAAFSDHLELLRAHFLCSDLGLRAYFQYVDRIRKYAQAPDSVPLLNGEDLIAMGYKPGPIFGQILRKIEDLQLEGVLQSREEAIQYLQKRFPDPVKGNK